MPTFTMRKLIAGKEDPSSDLRTYFWTEPTKDGGVLVMCRKEGSDKKDPVIHFYNTNNGIVMERMSGLCGWAGLSANKDIGRIEIVEDVKMEARLINGFVQHKVSFLQYK